MSHFVEKLPSLKAAYLIWKKPYMAAGGGTFIGEMMRLCKLANVFEIEGRYPEVNLEELDSGDVPEVILLSSEPFPFSEKDADEIRQVFKFSKVVLVDGEMFSWYGTRPVKAFGYCQNLLVEIHKKSRH